MIAENTQTQMRKGILEYCVLLIISRGEIYASDIIAELKQAKLLVVEGTLYPLLTRLKNNGLATNRRLKKSRRSVDTVKATLCCRKKHRWELKEGRAYNFRIFVNFLTGMNNT